MASSRRPLPVPEIESRLRARFGDDIAEFSDQHGHPVATVTPERYREVARFLHDEPELALDFFDFSGGVDREDEGFEVVTHLYSTIHNHHVRVKVRLAHEEPHCPTISDIYPGANWHERETSEMFGIEFDDHPQPVKLLLPEPFEGHPLRKDFALMSREAKPWPGAVEGEEEEEE
ncbi:MAG: NADH-quinone oxidoreductase subunit C [Actinomycetota bacterium]